MKLIDQKKELLTSLTNHPGLLLSEESSTQLIAHIQNEEDETILDELYLYFSQIIKKRKDIIQEIID